MALEATLIHETEIPIPMTVSDSVAITKGSILKMTDENTAVLADGDTDIVAGIAAEDKVADDGKTKLGVYKRGIFKVFIGAGGCTVGDALITDASTGASNELATADVNSENIFGRALGTAADTESVLAELNPFTVNLA